MENQGILLYIGIALIILLVLWYIWTANNLIAKRNRVKQCRSGICVALKQRNDMYCWVFWFIQHRWRFPWAVL
mgnify:CR=1 FL=1